MSRHYLGECNKFKALTNEGKSRAVIEANRCFNCLATGHIAFNCPKDMKCRICGPGRGKKHASALHEAFTSSKSVSLGAAERRRENNFSDEERDNVSHSEPRAVRKLSPVGDSVLLRTSAVRVFNPNTGMSTLAYAQHDTASQATLISEGLKNELGLDVDSTRKVGIRTLAEQTTSSGGMTSFTIQSLTTNETYAIQDALVVPGFTEEENVLPHSINVGKLDHFKGIKIPTISNRKTIDILIGQTDKLLLTVLEERESLNSDDPNLVFTRLGPIASGGRSCKSATPYKTSYKVNINDCCGVCECDELKYEVVSLKQTLRKLQLEDEVIQPSQTDEMARALVESNLKVVDGRYEVPVPLISDVVNKLPNNYVCALNRTEALRCTALKNTKTQQMLTETFHEMITEGWIVPVNDVPNGPCWYLPFFITKQDKPRVVFDGAATFKGLSINHAVLSGINLLNNLTQVLTRFRVGRFACMADLSKCFFQVSVPESQRDLFRVVWYRNNNLEKGEAQVFRFTRHVWGINSSPYVALFAIEHLVNENITRASLSTLTAIENNRYMDDLLIATNSLNDLQAISQEAAELFQSRGFKLRKWVANSLSKSVLSGIPSCDLGPNIREIDLGSQLMPDSKALGLAWDVEHDSLRVSSRHALCDVTTRREMLRAIARLFDPLGFLAPWLLAGKLLLQKVTISKLDWDEKLPPDIVKEWKLWIDMMKPVMEFSIPRSFFPDGMESGDENKATYQLHGFCDASNRALSCVIYLRRIADGSSRVAFVQAKSKVILVGQANWVISRKELEAARLCAELMLTVSTSLQHLSCSLHFWTDSQVVLRWIANPDLHLPRFVKRRVDKILLVTSADAWSYISSEDNPADVGTREDCVKRPNCSFLWLHGPEFLLQENLQSCHSTVMVRRLRASEGLLVEQCTGLDLLINAAPSLYVLKKRAAYLSLFKLWIIAKYKRIAFTKPVINAKLLECAFLDTVRYVQAQRFGAAVEMLKMDSSDAFDSILKKLNDRADNAEDMRRISELKTLRRLRPCVDADSMLRIDGRLENADLPVDAKHPLILPGRHALTRLIILHEHAEAGHAGPSYTLMRTRQHFWIIHGVSSIKYYLSHCSACARRNATPIR